jgi:hypothetical protein
MKTQKWGIGHSPSMRDVKEVRLVCCKKKNKLFSWDPIQTWYTLDTAAAAIHSPFCMRAVHVQYIEIYHRLNHGCVGALGIDCCLLSIWALGIDVSGIKKITGYLCRLSLLNKRESHCLFICLFMCLQKQWTFDSLMFYIGFVVVQPWTDFAIAWIWKGILLVFLNHHPPSFYGLIPGNMYPLSRVFFSCFAFLSSCYSSLAYDPIEHFIQQ